jgi:hypothetical protein
MLQDAGVGGAMSPAQVLAQQQARKRSQGFGGKVLGGLKGLWGVAASPFATALDVVPGYEPEQVGSFNIFQQGGKSLEHVGGDAYQLGRSVLTGKDTLSESPSARAYQAAGEGITGAFAAAMPYVDVATAVYPFAKAATPAGALAIEQAAGEKVGNRLLNQEFDKLGRQEARLSSLPANMTTDDAFAAIAKAESPQEIRSIKSRFERQLLDNYIAKRAAAADSLPDVPSWYEPEAAERWKAWGESVPISYGKANETAIESMGENPFAPPPTISVSGPNLKRVLDSGQYGSMFDEGAGVNRRGTDYENWRKHNEYLLYGTEPGKQPPIYGFLRDPADPYAASSYGVNVNVDDAYGATSSLDNFFITVRPNRRITSAPADSFRVNTPEEILPLTSMDKPHSTGYREIQMWGGPISSKDITNAELVIPDPSALFSTIVADTSTNVESSLKSLISRIDAYLGPDGTITQLEKSGIPIKVTIRRDYGRSPIVGLSDVRQTLEQVKEQAKQTLIRYGENPNYYKDELVPSIIQDVQDPTQLYAHQLAMQNNFEAAANAMRMSGAGANANPFFIPTDWGYDWNPMMATLPPEKIKSLVSAYSNQITPTPIPGIGDVAVMVAKNNIPGLTEMLPRLFSREQLDDLIVSAVSESTSAYNPYAGMLSNIFGSRASEIFKDALRSAYARIPASQRGELARRIEEAQSYSGLG